MMEWRFNVFDDHQLFDSPDLGGLVHMYTCKYDQMIDELTDTRVDSFLISHVGLLKFNCICIQSIPESSATCFSTYFI